MDLLNTEKLIYCEMEKQKIKNKDSLYSLKKITDQNNKKAIIQKIV